MADYITTDEELTDIADAIRARGGTSESLSYPNGFKSGIAAIPDTTYSLTQSATDPHVITLTGTNGDSDTIIIPDENGVNKSSITLSTTWNGNGPYTQAVTASEATITANSKVDLQPNADQIAQIIEDGVQALFIANNDGTLTAYAVGSRTSTAMTVQCTIMEVVS